MVVAQSESVWFSATSRWYRSGAVSSHERHRPGVPAQRVALHACNGSRRSVSGVDPVQPSSSGTVAAVADDVGIALSRAALVPLRGRSQRVERAAGLPLKPKKCALVLLWAPCSGSAEYELRRWLVEVVQEWGRFKGVPASVYLGFVMGPGGWRRS